MRYILFILIITSYIDTHTWSMETSARDWSWYHKLNRQGQAPIHEAAKSGDVDCLKLILSRDADIYQRNKRGWTAFYIAKEHKHTDVIALLNTYDYIKLLYKAIESNDAVAVENLLQTHPNVIKKAEEEIYYNPPLHYAVKYGNAAIAQLIIEYGASIDNKSVGSSTALHQSAHLGRVDIVKLLLHHKADPTATDRAGETPFHVAAAQGHLDIVKCLLPYMNINHRTNSNMNALGLAAYEGKADVVEFLISKGANVNQKDYFGTTPLQHAIRNRHTQTAALLRKHNAIE